MASSEPAHSAEQLRMFERGYTIGRCAAYCEQVVTGAKLAAQLGCTKELLPEVLETITSDGCESLVEDWTEDRVSVWIFKHEFVRKLISELHVETPPTASGVWSMGKLFGYSDSEIGLYLAKHGLA